MNYLKVCLICLMGLFHLTSFAQTKSKVIKSNTIKKKYVKKEIKNASPKKQLYFPDYHTFYDPNRGYIYWNTIENDWTSSLQLPTFMSSVDMSKTRVEILKGLSLDLHPENNYPNYMKLYPAQLSDPKIPVPNQTNGVNK